EAGRYLSASLAVRRQVAAARPDNDMDKRALASSLGLLGDLWLKVGDPAQAVRYFDEEAAVRRAFPPKLAANFEIRRELSGLYSTLAEQREGLGDPPAQRDALGRALETREALARERPNDRLAEHSLMLSYQALGTFHLIQLNDPAGAHASYRKALDGFRHLA